MLDWPMSSPQMMTMLGFFACASAGAEINTSAHGADRKAELIFMECFIGPRFSLLFNFKNKSPTTLPDRAVEAVPEFAHGERPLQRHL